MKTKAIYFIAILLMGLMGTSCDDKENDQPTLIGAWNYETPHFIFDYAQDSISLVMMQGKQMSISVADLKSKFLTMATDKMKDYFVGVEFKTDNKLKINMQMQGGTQGSIGADYIVKGNVVEVALDTNDMKQLTGGKAINIPKISFKYSVSADKMLMYFDQAYVQTVVAMMQDQIVDMIIPMLGVPPMAQEQVKAAIKAQIPGILDKIVRLEIGFNLTRENLLK